MSVCMLHGLERNSEGVLLHRLNTASICEIHAIERRVAVTDDVFSLRIIIRSKFTNGHCASTRRNQPVQFDNGRQGHCQSMQLLSPTKPAHRGGLTQSRIKTVSF
jgi:hypothetical protein